LLSVALSIADASAIEGGTALKFIDQFVTSNSGGLATPRQSTFGPDGNLYVTSSATDSILRYSGATGAFLDTFVASGSGGLVGPGDLSFGPDGDLYVSSTVNFVTGAVGTQVLRYDGTTGAFLNVAAGGLSRPLGITFGSDGSLYIANQDTNQILRENSSGLSVFVPAGSGGLSRPRKAVFGSDGNMYVASAETEQVLRYNGQTGAFMDVFANTNIGQGVIGSGPMWLQFGTDGYLYTTAVYPSASSSDSAFLRFNAATGAFVDSLAPSPNGWSLALGPGNVVYDSGNSVGNWVNRYGATSLAAFTVGLNSASTTTVTVDYSTADGTGAAGKDYVAVSGTLVFTPGLTSQTILVQSLDDGVTGAAKTFSVNLTNPVGATLARGQGAGTIQEGDSTKFYVADAGNAAKTYRYGISGNAIANSVLATGDSAPLGIASNPAGTNTWVMDASKNVYKYDSSGALVGSWSVAGLGGSAQLTGIATNGTDIWLVDAKTHRVYTYSGAASRTSGSQNAARSFNLNSNDSNPQDMVTDGTSIWVVDGTALKVFKYTLSGSLLGSWAIDPINTHPTGITINPSNVSDIWIVDNGTDKVYQYVGAASRTSGSQNAAAIFALNPYDTNPQGIADPPPAGMAQTLLSEPALSIVPTFAPDGVGSSSGLDAFGAVSSQPNGEAIEVMLVCQAPPKSAGPEFGHSVPSDNLFSTTNGASMLEAAIDTSPLADESNDVIHGAHCATSLLDSFWGEGEDLLSAVAADTLLALWGC
jgi:hypothetical protein